MIMKKVYTKPEMKVYQLQHQSPLLQASVQSVGVMRKSYNDDYFSGDHELEDL